jgi:hypothetical protein
MFDVKNLGFDPHDVMLTFYTKEPEETWKPIPGTNGLYEASSLGEIKSHHRRGRGKKGKLLTPKPNKNGYLVVTLYTPAYPNGRTHYVHHLIARTFLGPRPDGCHILHWDDCKLNNSATNLRYDTPPNNYIDGLFNRNPEHVIKEHTGIRVAVICIRTGVVLMYLGDLAECAEYFCPGIEDKAAHERGLLEGDSWSGDDADAA